MIYGLVIAIHVIACIILIAVILLQAGRGGGLSETFGGESRQTIFGTKVTTFFTRATVVAASLFLVTSLVLGIMTSRRGRSLIELQRRRALPVAPDINFSPKAEESATETVLDKTPDKEGIPLAEPEKLPTN